MSHIKVNYFDVIKNKRTSTTINRNIALFFCFALHRDEFNACAIDERDYFISRSVQDFVNSNSDFCHSKDSIECTLLQKIRFPDVS